MASTTQSTRSALLYLPAELRNAIYSSVLLATAPNPALRTNIQAAFPPATDLLSFALTSRKVYTETIELHREVYNPYFATRTFTIDLSSTHQHLPNLPRHLSYRDIKHINRLDLGFADYSLQLRKVEFAEYWCRWEAEFTSNCEPVPR